MGELLVKHFSKMQRLIISSKMLMFTLVAQMFHSIQYNTTYKNTLEKQAKADAWTYSLIKYEHKNSPCYECNVHIAYTTTATMSRNTHFSILLLCVAFHLGFYVINAQKKIWRENLNSILVKKYCVNLNFEPWTERKQKKI